MGGPSVQTSQTLPALLTVRALRTPTADALRFEGQTLDCAEVLRRAETIAADLQALGVAAGDRVALVLPNGLDFPVAWLAVPFLRAVVVPVNVAYRGRDLAHVLRHSGATVALTGPEQLDAVRAAALECPNLAHVRVLQGGRIEPPPEADATAGTHAIRLEAWVGAPSDEPVTIQYTSGTTGLPKGCVLAHAYWLRLARTVQRYLKLSAADVILTAQPQSYMDPSWNLVLGLLVGAPLVVLPRFSATRFWSQARESGATFFYCIGTMPLYLMKQSPDAKVDRGHSVHTVYCSGIPAASHDDFEHRWGCTWRETYGSTELGVVLLVPPSDVASVGSGSMGEVVEGREIRIADAQGREVPRGTAGELWVRGPDLMLRYHDDPAGTAAWMPDGWARTGDVVVERAPGRILLVGRTKDMIRRAGENIAAAEVEGVLAEHPGVRAAACIAVPDPLRGEEVKAYVQPTDDAAGSLATPAALHRFVAERLASFKVPRYFECVESFPLTQSEKIAKSELIRSRSDHRTGAWDAEARPEA